MKFYITSEGIQKLKRSFLNLKLFSIINVPEILENNGYTYETIDEYGAFIINKKIISMINNYSKSKRIRGIIYSNPKLNTDIIENLDLTISKNIRITDVVLIDEYNLPKLQQFYKMFNEIIFFPSIKKIRIIEAKNIREHIDWKI
jgi:hypothetical protein